MSAKPGHATARAYVSKASTAPAYWMIGVLWRVLATGVQTGGSFCLLDQRCSAGSGPPRHFHPQDEGLFVVNGRVSFQAGGKHLTAGPGSLVSVPRNTEHSFIVDEEAHLINFYLPAGFEMLLMGAAIPAMADDLPPKDLARPPHSLLARLSEDYGGAMTPNERETRPNPDAVALPAIASAETSIAYTVHDAKWSVLADGLSTAGSYCAFDTAMPQGIAIGPHRRDYADEVYYVLEGDAEIVLDDLSEELSAGSLAFAPRGTVVALRIVSPSARLLIIHTSPGYERLLKLLATTDASAKRHDSEISVARVRELHADIGLRDLSSWERVKTVSSGVEG